MADSKSSAAQSGLALTKPLTADPGVDISKPTSVGFDPYLTMRRLGRVFALNSTFGSRGMNAFGLSPLIEVGR